MSAPIDKLFDVPDVMRLIIEYLEYDRLCLAWTCHRMMNLVTPSCRGFINTDKLDEFCQFAAIGGHLNQLKWLYKTYGYISALSYEAGSYGHLPILIWLRKQGVTRSARFIDDAAEKGQLRILDWYHCMGLRPSQETIEMSYPRTKDIVLWAHRRNVLSEDEYRNICCELVENGDHAMLKLLGDKVDAWSVLSQAIKSNDMNLVQEYLPKSPFNYVASAWTVALENGRVETLDLFAANDLLEHIHSVYDAYYYAYQKPNNVPTLNWIFEHNITPTLRQDVYDPNNRQWMLDHVQPIQPRQIT